MGTAGSTKLASSDLYGFMWIGALPVGSYESNDNTMGALAAASATVKSILLVTL